MRASGTIPMNPAEVTKTDIPGVGTDLSIMSLFFEAHIVVQIVMIGLLLASIWSWAIIAEKIMLLARTRRETDDFEHVFWSGQSLEELYQTIGARPASPRRCSPPRWGCLPLSPRSSSTTSSPTRCRATPSGWKALPTSSRPSCPGKWTREVRERWA
jgi:hypothetical protein